jgi:hypothetical protein
MCIVCVGRVLQQLRLSDAARRRRNHHPNNSCIPYPNLRAQKKKCQIFRMLCEVLSPNCRVVAMKPYVRRLVFDCCPKICINRKSSSRVVRPYTLTHTYTRTHTYTHTRVHVHTHAHICTLRAIGTAHAFGLARRASPAIRCTTSSARSMSRDLCCYYLVFMTKYRTSVVGGVFCRYPYTVESTAREAGLY